MEESQQMQSQTEQSEVSSQPLTQKSATGNSDAKTNAIIAWLFAPISSFVMKDQQDPFVKNHVYESLYFGIFSIILVMVFGVISLCVSVTFGSLFGYGLTYIISCGVNLLWLVVLVIVTVPRIMGIIKAMNHETWTVPYISQFMSKYIKL